MNLSRILRPKRFEEVVGQDVVKSLLKNSLFLNKIFPSYIFAGERGCGKTTSARIFAAALNCQDLELFQKDPKTLLPCLSCPSCQSMQKGDHADFFELDAASNTGVDNIRSIIETAFYTPVLGKRRIFLIDEAHMLSKAAFNALLKILEEPPATAVFLLATTELEKIIPTVRSRSFLCIFPALSKDEIFGFLKDVCLKKNIKFEDSGLQALANISQGCPRDALNCLDQLAAELVSQQAVLSAFGLSSVDVVVSICQGIIEVDPLIIQDLFNNKISKSFDPEKLLCLVVNGLVFIFEIIINPASINHEYMTHKPEFEKLAKKISKEHLSSLINQVWLAQKDWFYIVFKREFLKYLFLDLASQGPNLPQNKKTLPEPKAQTPEKSQETSPAPLKKESASLPQAQVLAEAATPQVAVEPIDSRWQEMLSSKELAKESALVATLNLVSKIETASEFGLKMIFPRLNEFASGIIKQHTALLKGLVKKFFNHDTIVLSSISSVGPKKPLLTKPSVAAPAKSSPTTYQPPAATPTASTNRFQSGQAFKSPAYPPSGEKKSFSTVIKNWENSTPEAFNDEKLWPNANLLIKHFPGKIRVEKLKK